MAFSTHDGRTQTALSEINMIPFIDIMLVLLVIFMITAPVIQSGIDIQVPRTQTVRELSELRIVVQMDARQDLYLQDQPVNINDLIPGVQRLQPDPALRRVYLMVDEAVPWGSGTLVMAVLQAAGVEAISVVTEPIDE
jgi:biopolymer transport protein ExbD/biopolymer transport protein TolR